MFRECSRNQSSCLRRYECRAIDEVAHATIAHQGRCAQVLASTDFECREVSLPSLLGFPKFLLDGVTCRQFAPHLYVLAAGVRIHRRPGKMLLALFNELRSPKKIQARLVLSCGLVNSED